jgi:hypothetical protein
MRVRSLGAVAVRSGGGTPARNPLRFPGRDFPSTDQHLSALGSTYISRAFIQPKARRLEHPSAAPTVFEAPPRPLSTVSLKGARSACR